MATSGFSDSVLGDRPTSGFESTVNSLSLTSIMLQDESLNVRGSFDAEISGLECTVSEPPLPSACSSPMRMQESPFPTSSSSQESLVNLIQPVGRHKQVKRKQDLSSGLLAYLEKSEDREERLQEQGQAMLKERARDDSFFDTIMVMDDWRAMVSKDDEDRHANKEMHDELLLHSHKAQESQDQLLMVMARHADSAARHADSAARQVEARQMEVRQMEQQKTFRLGFWEC
ncbi:hypothetical protein JOQ06_017370 [Pogonophryne albipinna]|uniref:Uncharacterized protein n=1 Tax=Pogonophryne albipinna TaxID=1090488 RepID=A0AAD6B3G3_9TELE|nr:hypothetical protein JOQ06_017370 [Pogonophryne albipinna]